MYSYNYRIFDRYNRSVASIAVLGDEGINWRPNQFGYNLFGCRVDFQFPIVKLLDYTQRQGELEESRNPFATVVMAHLAALETRDNRTQRKQQKLNLVRRLYQQGFEREQVINLLAFVDWMLTLPLELEQEFRREVEQIEEETRMGYVTSFERIAMEKGIEQGIEQGIKQGLIKGISLGLKLKFGESGQSLLPEIESIGDVDLSILKRGLKPHPLRVVCFVLGFKSPLQNVITNYELRITNCLMSTVLDAIETVDTPEKLRQIYQPATE